MTCPFEIGARITRNVARLKTLVGQTLSFLRMLGKTKKTQFSGQFYLFFSKPWKSKCLPVLKTLILYSFLNLAGFNFVFKERVKYQLQSP